MKDKPIKIGKGWTWEFDGECCCRVYSYKHAMEHDGKPTPGAKPVYVAIVPMAQYRELLKKRCKTCES